MITNINSNPPLKASGGPRQDDSLVVLLEDGSSLQVVAPRSLREVREAPRDFLWAPIWQVFFLRVPSQGPMPYCTILYYTILYYTILYYTILCYAMLCYTILYIILYSMFYIILYILYTFYYILYTLYYTILDYTRLD